MDRGLIQTVRDRVDLVELVGQYVPLRRVGSRFVARCPFHQERTASFSVSAEQGVYHCFGCKASGDAFRFYAEMEGLTFPEALRALAERAGVEVPETRDPERIAEDRRQRDVSERLYAACEAAAVYFERCLADEAVPFSALARLSLVDRGISEETARAFRLGYAPARWDGLAEHLRAQRMSPADAELAGLLMPGRGGGSYDRFRHRLMFPVLDKSGRVVAFSGRILPSSEEIAEGIVPEDAGKYINSPETPLYRKGELLFGLANARMSIRQKQEALLVEGNFDVVQMHQHGFTETVAPLGTSFTEPQARLLRRFAETVVLVFDGDEAGRKAARAAHGVCAKVGLAARVGVLPGRTDPDAFLRSTEAGRGVEGMQALLKGGQSISEWLIRDAAAFAGDNLHGRLAALRAVAPVIAEASGELEKRSLVQLARQRFHVEESVVQQALREATTARPAGVVVPPTVAAEGGAEALLARVGAALPQVEGAEPATAKRKLSALLLELLLVRPQLLDSADAATACQFLDGVPALVVREARGQWAESQRLHGPTLLEVVPTEEQRQWMAARMVVGEVDAATAQRLGQALADTVRALRGVHLREYERLLQLQSARLGAQGDPAAEEAILNEVVAARRQRVMGGATGEN